MAAIARRYLIEAKGLQSSLDKNAVKALLMVTEAEYYLEKLESNNFDTFSKPLNRFSRMVMPYRFQKAYRNNKPIVYL
jgi:hypothetical protein